jgi:hypothetical protein
LAKIDIKAANVGTIAGDGSAVGVTEQNKVVLIFQGLVIRGGADRVNHVDLINLMSPQ